MARTVGVREAQSQLESLVEAAHRGEGIILTVAGKPHARLVPLAPSGKRRLGFVPGRVTEAFLEPLPPDELAEWQ